MGISTSFVVEAPLGEVFAWHARPGALTRLAPPFMPMPAVQEAGSLRDGTALLGLGWSKGPKWVAQHQAADYDPPRRFVDVGVVPITGTVGSKLFRWRHQHDFEAVDEGRTRVIDAIDTPVPAAMLTSMFAYRHRQLADDLSSQRRMRAYRQQPLTVAVSGSSGSVGRQLVALLTTGGHRVVKLVRREPGPEVRDADGNVVVCERRWDTGNPADSLFDGVDAVAHLAGAPIAGRFGAGHKEKVRDSRVGPTRRLAELSDGRPFVSASAVGYYGPDRRDPVDEFAEPGEGFLAETVCAWEDDARAASGRSVMVRTGIVQSGNSGVLGVQRVLFEAGLGGPMGSGEQMVSWIALDDVVDVYYRALVDERMSGPINAVAPQAVSYEEWAREVGRVMKRPTWLRVPAFAPAVLLGKEGARELALAGQNVQPAALQQMGHTFRFSALPDALAHELGRAPLRRPADELGSR